MAIFNGRLARRSVRRRAALSLEFLEGRQLLCTVVVTNDNDSNPGSLRAALASAPSGSTVTFAPASYATITLTGGPIAIVSEALTIRGPGASLLTVTTAGKGAAIQINNSTTGPNAVNLSKILFANCQQALNNVGAVLTVQSCAFRSNDLSSFDGAIASTPASPVQNPDSFPAASLTLTGDAFAGNSANFGRAVSAGNPTTMTSCLFVGNLAAGAGGQGGAIYAESNSTLVIRNTHFVSNLADADFLELV